MAKRSGIMLCYPFEEKRLASWNCPVIVQPKLDGVRCRYLADSNQLISSSGRIITGVPHILDELARYAETGIELDGELYNHHLTFEQINSIVSRTTEQSPRYRDAQFHVFDIVRDSPQADRLTSLRTLPLGGPVRTVDFSLATGLPQILELLRHYCDEGYEGIIVRHPMARYERKRSTGIMKLKPRKSDVYEIVGYKEEFALDGTPKGRLGALICVGDDGTEFAVGSGFSDAQRQSYWDNLDLLVGSYCRVLYQHITPGRGVPRFPIFSAIVEPMEPGDSAAVSNWITQEK